MEKEPKNLRSDNLLEAIGVSLKALSPEERAMKTLLAEEYKKRQKNLLTEVKKWRKEHPEATFGDSIRALYQELEAKD